MFAKLTVSFVLLALFAQYAELKITYGHLALNARGPCLKLDWNLSSPAPIKCIRSWKANGKMESDEFSLYPTMNLKDGTHRYSIIDTSGKMTGENAEIKIKGGVTKFTSITKDGKIGKIACGTDAKEVTDEQSKVLKELCNEPDLKKVDQKDCP